MVNINSDSAPLVTNSNGIPISMPDTDTIDTGGALSAVQDSSDRGAGNLAAASPDPSESISGLGAKIKESMESACESMGIPKEMAGKLMGMFGIDPAMLEMVMNVMQKLSDHGVQGVGGEMGNPQANLSPQPLGVEQPDLGLTTTQPGR